MRVIVTGATGFLGQHLVDALSRQDDVEVIAARGDVRQPGTFEELPRADVVYHLAAISNVPEGIREPVTTWDVNAHGTLQLLEWARRTECGRVVYVSSGHVYGRPQYSPIDEEHPLAPVTPYGASKMGGEALARAYHATYGVETVIVRPFNVYGPGQGRGFLIPDVLLQLHETGKLVLGNPEPVRDFTYVDDATAFFIAAGIREAAGGEAINLGSGVGHSVREVVETALRTAGQDAEPFFDTARFRPVDVPELVVDNGKAKRLLDWAPRVGIAEGLRRTWQATADIAT